MGKFSNCFSSSLDAVDLYPITPGYKLGGKRRFTSFLTLLSSIGILIFVLVLFCIEIADLARHKNAQILVSEFTNNGDNITVFSNDSTFQMAFGLMTTIRGNTFRYDPMQIVVASVRDGNDTYLNRTIIQVELCQPYHFKNVNYSEYEGLYCFRFQDENELFVSDLDHRALQIRFYHCNVTAYQCPNNMDFLVKNTVFKGVYTSWSVNPMIYDTPLIPGYEVMTSGILMSIHREFVINVNTIEFITDNGWLWSSQTTQTVTNIQVIQQDMETVTQDESGYTLSPDQGAAFLTIQIARGGNKVIYQRSYKKIQDVFAEVTGLAQILIPIIGLCLLPYMPFAKLKMYEKTANELYYFNRGRKPDSAEPNGEPEKPNEEAIAAGEGLGDEGNPGSNEEGRQGKISSVLSLESVIKGIPEMNENPEENKDQEDKPNEDVVVVAEGQGGEGNALNKEEEGSQDESDSRLSLESVIKNYQEENKGESENEWVSVEIIDVSRAKSVSDEKLNQNVSAEAGNQDKEGTSLNKQEEGRQGKSSSVLSLDSVIRKLQTPNKNEGVSVDIIDVAKDKSNSENRYEEPNEEIIMTAKRQDKEEEGRQGKIGSVSSLENLINSVQEMNINMIDRSKDKPVSEHRRDQTNISENKEDIKPVKVSFWVWLKNLFKPQPEVKILAKTINQIEAHMDFVTLMKHLVEIDKFKKCVLNDDQLTIFNSIQKPVRSVDEDGNRDDISHEEEEKDDERVGTSSRRSRSVKEAYENLKKKEVLTEFDKRLLEHYRKKSE